MGSTDLDDRVQVRHSFIIGVAEIRLSPGAKGGTRSSDFVPKSSLDLWMLGEFEEAEGQCVGSGFI